MAPGPRPQPASGAPSDDGAQRRRAALRPAVQQALDALRTLNTRGAQPGDVERAAAALAASDLLPPLAPVLDLPADAPPALRAGALKSRLLSAVEVFRRSRPSGVPLPPAPDGAPPEETLYRFLTRWYVEGDPRTLRALLAELGISAHAYRYQVPVSVRDFIADGVLDALLLPVDAAVSTARSLLELTEEVERLRARSAASDRSEAAERVARERAERAERALEEQTTEGALLRKLVRQDAEDVARLRLQRRTLLLLCGVWLAAVPLLLAGLLRALGAAGGAVRVAVSLPFSGDFQEEATAILRGFRLALAEADGRAGGWRWGPWRSGGWRIDVDPVADDTAYDRQRDKNSWAPARAREVAAAAAQDGGTVLYVGHFNSGASDAALPAVTERGLLMLSPANTDPTLSERAFALSQALGAPRSYARTAASDRVNGAAAGAVCQGLGGAVALLYFDDPAVYGTYGQNYVASLQRVALTYPVGDFRLASAAPQLLPPADAAARMIVDHKLAAAPLAAVPASAARIDTVVLGVTDPEAAGRFVADVRSRLAAQGRDDVLWVAGDTCLNSRFVAAAGPWADGVWVLIPTVPAGALRADSLRGRFPAARAFYERYAAQYGANTLAGYEAQGYEIGRVTLAALERAAAAGRVDRDTVREAVLATRNFPGLFGNWSFQGALPRPAGVSADEFEALRGDTSLSVVTAVRVAGGAFDWSSAGVRVYVDALAALRSWHRAHEEALHALWATAQESLGRPDAVEKWTAVIAALTTLDAEFARQGWAFDPLKNKRYVALVQRGVERLLRDDRDGAERDLGTAENISRERPVWGKSATTLRTEIGRPDGRSGPQLYARARALLAS